MKKLLIIIICILACALAPAETYARADTLKPAYARAAVTDGYFFTQKDENYSLFAVPYTYCVEVVRDDGEWYYVKYADDTAYYKAIYGYVRKEDFTPLYERPDVTYLVKVLTVTYRANESSPSLPVLNEINMDAAFYGTYYAGATAYSYVYCQGSFGYIAGANDDYPLNITDPPDGDDPKDDDAADGGVNPQIIVAVVLVGVAAAALGILFFSTRKHAKPEN